MKTNKNMVTIEISQRYYANRKRKIKNVSGPKQYIRAPDEPQLHHKKLPKIYHITRQHYKSARNRINHREKRPKHCNTSEGIARGIKVNKSRKGRKEAQKSKTAATQRQYECKSEAVRKQHSGTELDRTVNQSEVRIGH